MRRRARGWILAGIGGLAAAAGACNDAVEPGHRTAMELSADRETAGVDDLITFRYDARGRTLAGILIDYGDGVADTIPAHGAQTAGGFRPHRYQDPGEFTATAQAVEASGAVATATVTVAITGPPDG